VGNFPGAGRGLEQARVTSETASAPESQLAQRNMRREKRSVAGSSVLAALVITSLKMVVGLTTGSLGILSEAAHSGLDLVAAMVTYFSVRVSDKPADADHQYGHGKVENFSAFIETFLLLLTCVWIIYEAQHRLFFRSVEIEPSIAAFAVMFLSIGIDIWRSRALGRIAVKYDSQALEADALHFSTDIWSSGVVILGLALVAIGHRAGVTWLRDADPVAALCVAGVVIWVSWRLARRTVDALLDAAPMGVRAGILDAVTRVEGVVEIDRVRIRRAGNRFFADLSVALPRVVTFQRSEQIVSNVTTAVQKLLPNADVMVHSLARPQVDESIFDRIRAVATRHNVNVHDVSVQDLDGKLHVEQHLELNENFELKEAHDRVTELESEIRAEVPEVITILTHIESEPATIEPGEEEIADAKLEKKFKAVAAGFPEIIDMHDVKIRRVRNRLYLSCHCTLPDGMQLSRVHDVQTELEIRLKQVAPQLFRVLIHPEPVTDNLR
jgi:cation diffusion facilitator family transporter